MFNLKRSLVCALMLLALLLQGQVQAAGMRCGPSQGHSGSAAMAPDTHSPQAHADAHGTPMAHHGHQAHADAAGTGVQPQAQDAQAPADGHAQVHAQASEHGDCSQLSACCHGAAMPAPLVAPVVTPSALMMRPHPAARPAMALIARLERPPILSQH